MHGRARALLIACLIAAPLLHAREADPRAVAVAQEHFRSHARAYGLTDPARELRRRSARTDELGLTHVRYDQLSGGVRVFEGEAIAHVDGEGKVTVTNALRPGLRIATTERVAEATAIATAVARWTPGGAYTHRAELVVLPAGRHSARTRLAWYVTLFADNEADGLTEWESFVDAHSGELVLAWDGTHRATVAGTAQTMYSGSHPISVEATADGRYALQDATRGGLYTRDMLSTTTTIGPIVSSATTVFGDGLRTDCSGNPNRATAGADAHAAMTAMWDYLLTAFGRNGVDGVGGQVHARVHYGSCTNNAVWSIACNCGSFSDGTTGNYLPFVSIDIVAHELGHGVVDYEADLTSRGESAGLNESSSDIFGALVEFHMNSAVDTPDYWLAERILWSNYAADGTYTQKAAIRYMDDPARDGRSPNCWSKSMRTSDPHLVGGPNNHMFYLLAEGGTSRCNGSVVTGIGRAKAGAIWYKALADYMTSGTDYAAARLACLNAASALYGSSSPERAAVNAAYAAINVK